MASIAKRTRTAFFLAAGCAAAVCPVDHARAECSPSAEPIKPALIRRVVQEPKAFFVAFPRGGDTMSEAAFQLAAREPKMVARLIAFAPRSLMTQQAAIGAGLRRFVTVCGASDPDVARSIQSLVASAQIPAVRRAFYQADDRASASAPAQTSSRLPSPSRAGPGWDVAGENLLGPSPDPFGRIEGWR